MFIYLLTYIRLQVLMCIIVLTTRKQARSYTSDGQLGCHKKNQNGCHPTYFLTTKYTEMLLRLGLCPGPQHCGSL